MYIQNFLYLFLHLIILTEKSTSSRKKKEKVNNQITSVNIAKNLVKFLGIGTFYELSTRYPYKMSKFKQEPFPFYGNEIYERKRLEANRNIRTCIYIHYRTIVKIPSKSFMHLLHFIAKCPNLFQTLAEISRRHLNPSNDSQTAR